MLREFALELPDGRHVTIRFVEGEQGSLEEGCDGGLKCAHDITPNRAADLFRGIDVDYDGDALKSTELVMMLNKSEQLFQALHSASPPQEVRQLTMVPRDWDDESTKELLELYLTGFTLPMLAQHFEAAVRTIVRRLSAVILGDDDLHEDPSKSRHQKPWHQDEMLFLASQLQVARTPTEIAALMDRDSLGIAFKSFQALRVPIPRHVIEQYHVTVREEPLGQVPLDGKPF
ncbi:hypothetical protein OAR17_02195 [Pontimonas sp.]|nr:hypothetical protein [Pontimonas sp.]